MNGVKVIKDPNTSSWIFLVEELSDELKELIRKKLSSICHGLGNDVKNKKQYSHENTLKEFIKRYSNKTEATKKGMIGELLAHLLILHFNESLKTVSPFFNMEEESIKKGFDLVIFNIEGNDLWLTEVKSGSADNESSDSKNTGLLGKAKTGLKNNLNTNNTTLWHNAINGAKLASEEGDIKIKVIEILEQGLKRAQENNSNSASNNVILVSVVYNSLKDKIAITKVNKFSSYLIAENIFNDLMVFSIQKETYYKIAQFLETESKK